MLRFTFHEERKGKENKMGGMVSLNTSTLHNPFCKRMHANKKTICSSCYAGVLEAFYPKGVSALFIENGRILSQVLKEIPVVTNLYCRFHSFGELLNKVHYNNLLSIAEANPKVTFALWTKRLDIVKNPIRMDNLIYVYSSPVRNMIAKLPVGFDKVFTVFSKSFLRENDIEINCEKKCRTCLKCYTRNDITFINEALR